MRVAIRAEGEVAALGGQGDQSTTPGAGGGYIGSEYWNNPQAADVRSGKLGRAEATGSGDR